MQKGGGSCRDWIKLDLVIQEEMTVLLEAVLLVSGVSCQMWYSWVYPKEKNGTEFRAKAIWGHSADDSTGHAGPTCISIIDIGMWKESIFLHSDAQ